jgi:hypothetical protein
MHSTAQQSARLPLPEKSATPLVYFACAQAATRAFEAVLSFIFRLLAIIVCGGGGGLLAWVIVTALDWTGVGGAIAGATIGMVLAALFWAGGVALMNALKR